MKTIMLSIMLMILTAGVFANPDWKVESSAYEYSMTITGFLHADIGISINSGDMLAAFVGDECRGVAEAVYEADYDRYFFYLTIFSNDYNGEEVSFKVYKSGEDEIHENLGALDFAEGRNVGTTASPFDLAGIETAIKDRDFNQTLKVYPNPASRELNVSLDESTILSIEILTLEGKVILKQKQALNTIDVSGLMAGYYIVKCKTAHKIHCQNFLKH